MHAAMKQHLIGLKAGRQPKMVGTYSLEADTATARPLSLTMTVD